MSTPPHVRAYCSMRVAGASPRACASFVKSGKTAASGSEDSTTAGQVNKKCKRNPHQKRRAGAGGPGAEGPGAGGQGPGTRAAGRPGPGTSRAARRRAARQVAKRRTQNWTPIHREVLTYEHPRVDTGILPARNAKRVAQRRRHMPPKVNKKKHEATTATKILRKIILDEPR